MTPLRWTRSWARRDAADDLWMIHLPGERRATTTGRRDPGRTESMPSTSRMLSRLSKPARVSMSRSVKMPRLEAS